MNKLKWCLEQNKGIELVEPNETISQAYFKDAEEVFTDKIKLFVNKCKNISDKLDHDTIEKIRRVILNG